MAQLNLIPGYGDVADQDQDQLNLIPGFGDVKESSAVGPTVHDITVTDGMFMYDPDSRSLDAIKDDPFEFVDPLIKENLLQQFESFLLSDLKVSEISKIAFDKLLLDDIFYKNSDFILHDDLLLSDSLYKILEHTIIDKLLLSDSSLEEIITANVITKVVTDYLDLADQQLNTHDKTIFSSLFLKDFINVISDKILIDKLLLADSSLEEVSEAITVITKVVTDYMNLSDEEKKEQNKIIRDDLFLLENFLKLYEKKIDDSMFLYDSYTKAVIGAITEVLVFAKIRSVHLLGESIEIEDNYLNVTTSIVSPD